MKEHRTTTIAIHPKDWPLTVWTQCSCPKRFEHLPVVYREIVEAVINKKMTKAEVLKQPWCKYTKLGLRSAIEKIRDKYGILLPNDPTGRPVGSTDSYERNRPRKEK